MLNVATEESNRVHTFYASLSVSEKQQLKQITFKHYSWLRDYDFLPLFTTISISHKINKLYGIYPGAFYILLLFNTFNKLRYLELFLISGYTHSTLSRALNLLKAKNYLTANPYQLTEAGQKVMNSFTKIAGDSRERLLKHLKGNRKKYAGDDRYRQ